ncbi:MAG: TetR/AcrR family transcriptional regulator [Desulfovibrionales bacterium]|nr:TetR/AcrR family transcriptional regulator [Desulfovibrionales bacterium]
MARPNTKREHIEEAAIRLFATKGLARTTIKDIATAAGVTEGALYRHYPGKEEMAWKLYNRELDIFTRIISDILLDQRLEFQIRLTLAIRAIYDYYHANTEKFAFILLTQHGFPEDTLPHGVLDPMDMAVHFVGQAIGEGEISPCDAELHAALLMGAILQPLVMHRYGRLELGPDTYCQVAVACLRVLGAKQ